jgi:hypothetical protein
MKSPEERKHDIERVFSSVGIKPVDRLTIDGEEVFIADGFVAPSLINNGYLIKFKVEPGEFPLGCFMTVWWTQQNKGVGSIAFYDALHDPGYSPEEKAKMRVNTVIYLARQDFKRRKLN